MVRALHFGHWTTVCVLMLVACGKAPEPQAPPADLKETFPIFEAADALTKDWRHLKVWAKSDWDLVVIDGAVAIQPNVDTSSTALARWIEFDVTDCPVVEWSWRVEAAPASADLTSRDAEDMAASLVFAFGDPGNFVNPDPVPTIRYVWAHEGAEKGAIIPSPYFPKNLRSIVVQAGANPGAWVDERRNLLDDYRATFDADPDEKVQVFALFTDNDHKGEPIEAYYRWARMLCSDAPDPDSIL